MESRRRAAGPALATLLLWTFTNPVLASDAGPFFLQLEGFCNVVQAWMTPERHVYGREVGCNSGEIFGGAFTGSSVALGQFGDTPRLFVFRADGTFEFFVNAGDSLGSLAEGTWTLGRTAERSPFWTPSLELPPIQELFEP